MNRKYALKSIFGFLACQAIVFDVVDCFKQQLGEHTGKHHVQCDQPSRKKSDSDNIKYLDDLESYHFIVYRKDSVSVFAKSFVLQLPCGDVTSNPRADPK